MHVCFTECTLNGNAMDVREPHKIVLPRDGGELELSFVDLAPTPQEVTVMSDETFVALRSLLLHSPVRILYSAGMSASLRPTLTSLPHRTTAAFACALAGCCCCMQHEPHLHA